jgi:hypothetical protein
MLMSILNAYKGQYHEITVKNYTCPLMPIILATQEAEIRRIVV